MAVPLLRTKLYIPPLQSQLVSRPRLLAHLDQSLDYRLTLLSAPAGFGKTTLLSEWTQRLEHLDDTPGIAWLSLDQRDNDPYRFLAYVIAALQQIGGATFGSEVLDDLESQQRVPSSAGPAEQTLSARLEEELIALLNEMDDIDRQFVLILDDYHTIVQHPIHEMVSFFLAHMPPHMHLIIAGRVDPPLALSRLRGRGQMLELRTADLRFDLTEVATFLGQTTGLQLSEKEIAALDARTEGWIVGLQMAALSIRDQDQIGAGQFIDALTSSHRYVLDYLADEVLLRQPKRLQAFLLETSVLDRLTAPLCDAVADPYPDEQGQDTAAIDPALDSLTDSQEILEYLERANLFVVPLDNRREWYRYHHLFGDLLRKRLTRTQPERLSVLHGRASEWFEDSGLISEAVQHAVLANNQERVARLVEDNISLMMDRGEITSLIHWLAELPKRTVRTRPWLCVAYAWILAYGGRLHEAEEWLVSADETSAHSPEVAGHIASIRSYNAWMDGDTERACTLGRAALEHLPEDQLVARSLAAMSLGNALTELGELHDAEQVLQQAIADARTAGNTHIGPLSISSLADILQRQGHLRQAAEVCRSALGLDASYEMQHKQLVLASGNVYGMLARTLLEMNEPDIAARLATQGVEMGEKWGQADTITFCSLQLACTLAALGDMEGAQWTIDQARQVAAQVSGWFQNIVSATEAEIRMQAGDLEHVAGWIADRGMQPSDPVVPDQYRGQSTFARFLIAQGQLSEALDLIERLKVQAEATGAQGHLVGILVLRATALHSTGRTQQAMESLERALTLSEPERQIRSFLDRGETIRLLLQKAVDEGIHRAWSSTLLAAMETSPTKDLATGQPFASQHAHADANQALVEPLSEREMEVLQLIAEGLTNREIGDRLYISPGTVKAHSSSIYGKLGVHSRTQAVARARELDLFPQ